MASESCAERDPAVPTRGKTARMEGQGFSVRKFTEGYFSHIPRVAVTLSVLLWQGTGDSDLISAWKVIVFDEYGQLVGARYSPLQLDTARYLRNTSVVKR